MRLSKRLELVASFVPEGSRLADVGTDHGYIPIALAERNGIRRAVANGSASRTARTGEGPYLSGRSGRTN